MGLSYPAHNVINVEGMFSRTGEHRMNGELPRTKLTLADLHTRCAATGLDVLDELSKILSHDLPNFTDRLEIGDPKRVERALKVPHGH